MLSVTEIIKKSINQNDLQLKSLMCSFATKTSKMKTLQYVVIFSLNIHFTYTSSLHLDFNVFVNFDTLEAAVKGQAETEDKPSIESDEDTVALGDDDVQPNRSINKLYKVGVDIGLINPEKYPLKTFKRDEQNFFRNLYKEYVSLFDEQMDYEEWLIFNNFGIMPDTQESLLDTKLNVTKSNKQTFLNTTRTGDILISGHGVGGFAGHAAIMITDNWVLEMFGGKDWNTAIGIRNNNRRISKSAWYENNKSSWIRIYRSPNDAVAREAASWATRNYFNPSGGSTKTIQITFKIDNNFSRVNPSYCSKLVVQAYHFGTGSKKVINTNKLNAPIFPMAIPSYFLSPYLLRNLGTF